jgi:hypothetical protein
MLMLYTKNLNCNKHIYLNYTLFSKQGYFLNAFDMIPKLQSINKSIVTQIKHTKYRCIYKQTSNQGKNKA